jgi:hypothetical protein
MEMGNASPQTDEISRLTARYHQEMIDSFYLLSNKYGYRPTYFLRMVEEYGGVEAARRLLRTRQRITSRSVTVRQLPDSVKLVYTERRLDS